MRRRRSKRLKYKNVHTKIGDGYHGWPEQAPFDKIIVTCSPEKVPQALVDQLKEGGRMIIPVGERYQQVLYLFKKKDGKLVTEALRPTLFVPMTGTAEDERESQARSAASAARQRRLRGTSRHGGEPTGWYYLRQMKVVTAAELPKANTTSRSPTRAGRGCRALQGFAIDGRKVHEVEVSCMARAKDIRRANEPGLEAEVMILFYDDQLGNRRYDFHRSRRDARNVRLAAQVATARRTRLGPRGDFESGAGRRDGRTVVGRHATVPATAGRRDNRK